MVTDYLGDALVGRPLDGTNTKALGDRALFRSSHPSARLRRLVDRRTKAVLQPFAEAIRDVLDADRRRNADEIAGLKTEVAELRRVLDLQSKLAEIDDRLDRVEARSATLKAVG